MKISNNSVQYSASDLVNFLGCNHLNNLDRRAAIGEIELPEWNNPSLKLLQKKGEEHEGAYISHLKTKGLSVCELDGQSAEATQEALKKGYDIITQARLKTGNWVGIADVLVKVDGESDLGNYHYEIEDTKLAKETKAGTVVQLCLYAELLADQQGVTPSKMRVVKPGDDFPKEEFQYAEFEAYFRLIKGQYQAVMDQEIQASKPYPVPKCDTCRWWKNCNQQWHDEDHLSLVANIRSNQVKELETQGIQTLESYANEPKPFREKPEQGNEATYEKVHNQAKI
ncbi:MAG: TM0106 family RecB-like putative nuclease, partial [Cyclobacteriaceae bacterium]